MCGNLGLLLVGDGIDAEPAVEAMARVVAMRGAQSYGFVAATEKTLRIHKAVLRKRADLASTLRAAVARQRLSRARPMLVAGHLRFATSSRSTAREAHPHSWLGPVAASTPVEAGARPRKATRLVAITHNGDFEGLDLGGCLGMDAPVVALDALRPWLAVRLGRPAPCAADSCAASGVIDLLFAAGDCDAAARLALAPLDDGRAGDASLRKTVAEALRACVAASLGPKGGKPEEALAERLAAKGGPSELPPLGKAAARTVARAAVDAYRRADLRSAVWRFLKHAHGAFGLAAVASSAPGAVVLGSVKQPMSLGLGAGFVAYASERAALHVGAVGAHLEARYTLKEGDVVAVAPSGDACWPGCAASLHLATTKSVAAAFAPLTALDGVNALMMEPVAVPNPASDVVGADLRDLPALCAGVSASFRFGENAEAAAAFSTALFDPARREKARLDLVVVGVEASLWVAEQFAVNLRAACPRLRVVAASANKALAALTACHNAVTCNGATPSETVFPSGETAARACSGCVALAVTHSGQSFPTLNAAIALKDAGADVFAVCGALDVVLADKVLGQRFARDAQRTDRLLSTGAGVRVAEAASCTTAATHVLLTELLLATATAAPGVERMLTASDLRDLRGLHDASVTRNLPSLCAGEAAEACAAAGRRWGDHAVEPLICFALTVLYVLASVTCGAPAVISAASAAGAGGPWVWLFRALDALLYAFFPVVAALALRLVQGRTLLARFGKRTVLILDVPMVHQCAVAFGQKLFGLAYGLNGAEFAGANPGDHAVHRTLHRVVRGTLVAVGVPDGRLKALVDVECATYLTALQLKSLSNWGVGAELTTLGHHSYRPGVVDAAVIYDFERPRFLSEKHHGTAESSDARRLLFLGPSSKRLLGADAGDVGVAHYLADRGTDADVILASHAVVEALYEGRVASLERLVGFYVVLHAMATRTSRRSRWCFGLSFDTWRSQAGTRVATTPSPTSPAAAVDIDAGSRNDIERVDSIEAFQHSLRENRSSLNLSRRGRNMDTSAHSMDGSWPGRYTQLSAAVDTSAYAGLGMDLSSSGYRWQLDAAFTPPQETPREVRRPSLESLAEETRSAGEGARSPPSPTP